MATGETTRRLPRDRRNERDGHGGKGTDGRERSKRKQTKAARPAKAKAAARPQSSEPAKLSRSGSSYIPALDGLRAFAVIAVVVYHMGPQVLPSGLLGVTIFFVLSGYLITGILIREWNKTGSIDLKRFWIHRIRRLFPAIVFMVATVLVVCAFLAPDLLTKLRRDLFAALFWFTNWWYIFQDVSYFEAMGAPSPVTHFWSLAIEEQFYLVWPPVLLLLFSVKLKRRGIQRIVLALAVVSVVLMAVLYVPGGDPSRVYYGTDTRAFSLLIGAFLAFAFPVHRMRGLGRHGLAPATRKAVGYGGIVACIALVVLMFAIDSYSPFMYYGGLLLASVLAGVMVIAAVDPDNALTRFFSNEALVYIGKISYGIYIWHYPIILLMTDFNATLASPSWWYALEMAVVFAAAGFSYHFVEQPIRQGCLGRIWKELRSGAASWGEVIAGHIVQLGCAVLLVGGATVACIVVPDTTTQEETGLSEGAVVPQGAFEAADQPVLDEGMTVYDYFRSKLGSSPALSHLSMLTLEQLAATPGDTPEEKARNTRFILIGDSVTAGLASNDYGNFAQMFPNAIIDSQVNRTPGQGLQVLDDYMAQGWDGPVVVFELGTNEGYTQENIESLVAEVPEGKMVFFITVRTPGAHTDAANRVLWTVAANHDNVELIDWYTESAGHSEYFDGDGTHLTGDAGATAYQNMILKALETLY